MEPERRGPGAPEPRSPLSPAERGRITRAAALRPLNVIVLVIGAGVFATTLAWWMVPLTLLTYAALVFLAARDPLFARRVLHGREETRRPPEAAADRDVSPERRARWLPRGETREKVEAALVVYRKVLVAIEESDEVTRAVLDDAIPKLHAAANRLVDVADKRERAAEVLRDLGRHPGAAPSAGEDDARALQERVRAADAEISEALEKMLALRSRVVRVSIDSGDREGAEALNASLDDLNTRLEALSETMTPPDAPSRDG
jgi:hypothetical protein